MQVAQPLLVERRAAAAGTPASLPWLAIASTCAAQQRRPGRPSAPRARTARPAPAGPPDPWARGPGSAGRPPPPCRWRSASPASTRESRRRLSTFWAGVGRGGGLALEQRRHAVPLLVLLQQALLRLARAVVAGSQLLHALPGRQRALAVAQVPLGDDRNLLEPLQQLRQGAPGPARVLEGELQQLDQRLPVAPLAEVLGVGLEAPRGGWGCPRGWRASRPRPARDRPGDRGTAGPARSAPPAGTRAHRCGGSCFSRSSASRA